MTVDLLARPDVWDDVVGQDEVITALTAAAVRPVHAYLFLGPPGSGRLAAACAFAALVLGVDASTRGLDVERAVTLARTARHPDLHVFEPKGASLLMDDATEIVRAASRSPVEGGRKILVLTEFHTAIGIGPALLKAVEEPSESTIFVIIADEVPPELVPIASRAATIRFGAVPVDDIVSRLRNEGATADLALAAAEAAAGDLARARLLVTDDSVVARRDAWAAVPDRLDGTGNVVASVVDEVFALIAAAQAPLDARHEAEVAKHEEDLEAIGGGTKSQRDDLAKLHKREIRRHRTAEIRYGLAILAAAYRDRVAEAVSVGRDAAAEIAAVGALTETADALVRNPNEILLLQRLLVGLPPR